MEHTLIRDLGSIELAIAYARKIAWRARQNGNNQMADAYRAAEMALLRLART